MYIKPIKRLWLFLFLGVFPVLVSGSPLISVWGFQIDPPEEYQYTGGDGRDRFSFQSSDGANLDIRVYPGDAYPSVSASAEDIQRRLKNQGRTETFEYRKKQAAILRLKFASGAGVSEGWGLCIELDRPASSGNKGRPILVALAYGPSGREDLQMLHFSVLDSIAPAPSDRHAPGPITEYTYPRGKQHYVPLAGIDAQALIYEHDAEGAQSLIDREFQILKRYGNSPLQKDAWIRFYRAVYRDAFDRLAHIAFVLERHWNLPPLENRDLAGKALEWVQSFQYERNFMSSDFVNPVTAALEGRGDCDSRVLLWALILEQADIPTAMMLSSHYKHAMGLADLPGTGAHFTFNGKPWLTAETTADVPIGLIAANMSDSNYWIGIVFE